MSTDCEMLGALLSERRRGELGPDGTRLLEAHLAGCARCRDEARELEAVLAAVELPPISAEELDALRARRVGQAPPRKAGRESWRLPAVLVAAAAAAVLTITVRPPARHHPPELTGAPSVLPLDAEDDVAADADSQELFPEMSADGSDTTLASIEDDVASLEGPGLFGSIDDQE